MLEVSDFFSKMLANYIYVGDAVDLPAPAIYRAVVVNEGANPSDALVIIDLLALVVTAVVKY
jgi:hypothetical protein